MELKNILENFSIDGEFISAVPFGNGHINSTFLVEFKGASYKKYILQKLNTSVFKEPEQLMENILLVTEFLAKEIEKVGGDPIRETLTVIKTRDNKSYYWDENGGFWRGYIYIENSMDFQIAEKTEHIYLTGKAFGQFVKRLNSFPAEKLHETIKNFHNTKDRLDNLKIAIKSDPLDRVKDITDEINFALGKENQVSFIIDQIEKGQIPLRVTHNDTKLNNILFDKDSEKPLCVIDLDTVMPGSFLYDYGDSIRSSTATALEDETNLKMVSMDKELFEAMTEGYLVELYPMLTKSEVESMPFAAMLITFEIGLRFLTDYIDGDIYFAVKKEQHNLDRARNQFEMARSIESNMEYMSKFIEDFVKSL